MAERCSAAARTADAVRLTTDAVERGVGVLLGADARSAAAAVAALRAADVLADGLAVHGLVIASRTGTDLPGAIAAIAAGDRLGGAWSDYERRAAWEEAEEELAAALRQPHGDRELRLDGVDAPQQAAAAVRSGTAAALVLSPSLAAAQHGLDELQAVVEHRWAARLGRVWGCPVRGLRSEDGTVIQPSTPPPADAGNGPGQADDETGRWESVITRCGTAYLDVLSARSGP
jgi:hypothetical protein